jgi:predicted acylesterase/phospholipase RssA
MKLKSTGETKKKCRALALEGGGDMGSYEVGILKAYVENLPPEEVMYDVVTGVSVGSINAAALSLHDIGKEKEAVEWMYSLWFNITKDNVYTDWEGGVAEGLFFKEGIFNNQPLRDFLNATFHRLETKKIFRRLDVSTVELSQGIVVHFNETFDYDTFFETVVASGSMPFAFPHAYIQNYTLVDGGSIWNVDISDAIKRCKEIVDDDKDIIMDIILCNGAQNITRDEHKSYNTIQNYRRYQQIRAYYDMLSDFDEISRGYPDVNFRYFAVPKKDLPSGFLPIGFKHEDILAMIEIGYEQGKEIIKAGEGRSFNEAIDSMYERKYPRFKRN